jgi:hypothetical protein
MGPTGHTVAVAVAIYWAVVTAHTGRKYQQHPWVNGKCGWGNLTHFWLDITELSSASSGLINYQSGFDFSSIVFSSNNF